jgi:drug/metabolite transporter (DMT)-like permease
MGLLNNLVPFGLIFWAQQHVTGGLAAILDATTPLWSVLLAHLLTRDEPLRPNRLAGVVLGVAGVAVVVGPEVALAGFGDGRGVAARAAVLLAAASYACAGLYGRRFRSLPPTTSAAGQLTASALIILPVACLIERPWTLPVPGAAAAGAVVGLALLSTALAYVVYFRLLRSAGATNLLLVTLLIPPSALLLGATVLGEPVEPRQLAGMALIGVGLAVIDGRPLRLLAGAARRPPGPPGPGRP